MDGLTIGRIVWFVFDQSSADQVQAGRNLFTSGLQETGNTVMVGDVYPAMVVRLHGGTSVNLKVFLDGTDTLWATSVPFSDAKGPRTWHWPERS